MNSVAHCVGSFNPRRKDCPPWTRMLATPRGAVLFCWKLSMYACFASARAQETGPSFTVPFLWHMCVVDGDKKPLLLQIPSLWKVEGIITKRFLKPRTPTTDGMAFRGYLSEGVDIFLKSVEYQGKADTMSASAKPCEHGFWTPWMASVGGLVIMRKTYPLFVENSHPETLHRGRMFHPSWAFVTS